MKKFAANYLVSEDGFLLKNGVVVVGEDGFAINYIDTKGDLRETEQLIFYNGIILPGSIYTKKNDSVTFAGTDNSFQLFILHSVAELNQFSIQNLIELGKQVQIRFPEMTIHSILIEIPKILMSSGGFLKEKLAGIYLLTGANLTELRFTPKSRLKKIF